MFDSDVDFDIKEDFIWIKHIFIKSDILLREMEKKRWNSNRI